MVGYYIVVGDTPHLEDLTIATFSNLDDAEKLMENLLYNTNYPDYGKYTNVRIDYRG